MLLLLWSGMHVLQQVCGCRKPCCICSVPLGDNMGCCCCWACCCNGLALPCWGLNALHLLLLLAHQCVHCRQHHFSANLDRLCCSSALATFSRSLAQPTSPLHTGAVFHVTGTAYKSTQHDQLGGGDCGDTGWCQYLHLYSRSRVVHADHLQALTTLLKVACHLKVGSWRS